MHKDANLDESFNPCKNLLLYAVFIFIFACAKYYSLYGVIDGKGYIGSSPYFFIKGEKYKVSQLDYNQYDLNDLYFYGKVYFQTQK